MSTVRALTLVDFDRITVAELRERGGLNWSLYPDRIGSFVAEMDFGCAPEIIAALHAGIEDRRFGYLPPVLVAEMARACATWLEGSYGWSVPPADIRPVGDVIAGLEIAIEHFSRPGSAVVVPTPAYKHFLDVPLRSGRKVVEVPMVLADNRWEFDIEALDQAFAAGAGMLILCSPYNPLGRVFTRAELLAVSEVAQRHGVRVFADEIHCPLVLPGATHIPYATVSPAAADHVITGLSASKAWNLAGLKCAHAVTAGEPATTAVARLPEVARHSGHLGVLAAVAAFGDGDQWLDAVLELLDSNRRLLGRLLAERLPEVAYQPPEAGYLAWLDCSRLGLGADPAPALLERARVALSGGPSFGAGGDGFVRLNFATSPALLEQIVERMATGIRG